MDIIYFIARYIPFWALPTIFVLTPFTLEYKRRDYMEAMILFGLVIFFCFLSLVFWIWSGGGKGVVRVIKDIASF